MYILITPRTLFGIQQMLHPALSMQDMRTRQLNNMTIVLYIHKASHASTLTFMCTSSILQIHS